MSRFVGCVASLAFVLAASPSLLAQKGGGGDKGGGSKPGGTDKGPGQYGEGKMWDNLWANDFDQAKNRFQNIPGAAERVLVYHVFSGNPETNLLSNPLIRDFILANSLLVRQPFDVNNPLQKELKIASAPIFVGMDKYLNDFGRAQGFTSQQAFLEWIKGVQVQIMAFQQKLHQAMAKAAEYSDKDPNRAVKELLAIAALNKKGYPEIEKAKEMINSEGEKQLTKARVLLGKNETEKDGLSILDAMARTFKGYPLALVAELEVAQHFAKKGDISGALKKIDSIVKSSDAKAFETEASRAKDLGDQIIKDGISGIRDALKKGVDGDVEAARDRISKIKKEYAGTDVAKHADTVLKDLEKQ